MENTSQRFKSEDEYKKEIDALRVAHKEWRAWTRKNKVGFFPIFTKDFVKKLPDISGNALKLYIYLGSFANNETGELIVSVKKMEDDFQCSRRTVQKWIEELVDLKLIKRIQPGYKRFTYTFIVPYTDDFISEKESGSE